ncbi:hypothetical protein GVAV_003179 [Gurleya vavrai]
MNKNIFSAFKNNQDVDETSFMSIINKDTVKKTAICQPDNHKLINELNIIALLFYSSLVAIVQLLLNFIFAVFYLLMNQKDHQYNFLKYMCVSTVVQILIFMVLFVTICTLIKKYKKDHEIKTSYVFVPLCLLSLILLRVSFMYYKDTYMISFV